MQAWSQSDGAMDGEHAVSQLKLGIGALLADQYSKLLNFLVLKECRAEGPLRTSWRTYWRMPLKIRWLWIWRGDPWLNAHLDTSRGLITSGCVARARLYED